jgi:hypothetical protein
MDDFNVSALHESKNEYGARLLTMLTPYIVEGFKSIFDEAYKMCKENNELEKYLMTFQNFLARIPKWNKGIIENEKARIIEKSGCEHLEDLVTCIHIIQLKLLTAIRVGSKQKKIDIDIPKLDDFIHKVYVISARKIYKNVYLYDTKAQPLQIQKNGRELEIIIQECILNAIRESIPVNQILKAYMDPTEEVVMEEIKEQIVEEPKTKAEIAKETQEMQTDFISEEKVKMAELEQVTSSTGSLTFSDVDKALTDTGKEVIIEAPKTIERLEEISQLRKNEQSNNQISDDFINVSDEHIPSNFSLPELYDEDI